MGITIADGILLLDHATWDARSESSSGWLKHLHCQDSLCVAIPTKRRQSTRNGWLTLTLSALGRVHNTRSTLRWLMTNIGFGIRCNRLGAILTPKILERRLNHEKKTSCSLSITILLVQLTDISVGLMSARGMPLQAKRLISVGAKCSRLNSFCQSGVYNLDRWIV